MPIDVDAGARVRSIAEATLQVAAERGAEGVTIRAVAEKLGGSTTLVTNYVPNRAELLANAVRYAFDEWETEADEALHRAPDRDALRTLVSWSCSTSGNDIVIRRLIIELLVHQSTDSTVRDVLVSHVRDGHDELAATARRSSVGNVGLVADVLQLVLHGFYLLSLEDPDEWTSERVTPIVHHILELLTSEARA